MATNHKHNTDLEFQHPGFSCFCHKPSLNTGHRHNDLELSISEHAGGVNLFGGHKLTLLPDRLVVMWGAMPHQTLRVNKASFAYGLRVPLHWVLQWKLPDPLIRRLLNFDVIIDQKRDSPCSDLALVKHWVRLMQSQRPEDREIVLLEVRARLLRLATEERSPVNCDLRDNAGDPVVSPSAGFGLFERILQIVSERYREPLSIPAIARELQVSRTHVMRHFHKIAGMTLLEYITERRISCAQRLIATTDMKILDIALESGFGSQGQFYSCFKRLAGEPPASYRRTMASEPELSS